MVGRENLNKSLKLIYFFLLVAQLGQGVWICVTKEQANPTRWSLEDPSPNRATSPDHSIPMVSSLLRYSLCSSRSYVTTSQGTFFSTNLWASTCYRSLFTSDHYLHGMPEFMSIIRWWWVHEANHNIFEVIWQLLLQVTNQVLWGKK